jgi:enamine deaminase RidA (YjgF/YER057c/UK114 family)
MPDDVKSTTALLPTAVPGTDFRFARGIVAGRFCFATGLSGTDYVNGLAGEVARVGHPLNGPPLSKRESIRLYRNLGDILAEGGLDFADVVRVDQYYTVARAVSPYHEVRREVFGEHIPPSTSNLHRRFLRTGQTVEVQAIACKGDVRHLDFRPTYDIHPLSGYSPALAAGVFRFIPGQTAQALTEARGLIDPEAQTTAGRTWKDCAIQLETDFIVRRKLIPSLEGAGATLETVVKAQVYLRDRDDVPGFNQAWLAWFKTPPATTIIATATPGFTVAESRIEINTISLASEGATAKQVVATSVPPLFDGHVTAVRAGEMLFCSGLMAVADGALIPAATLDERQPFFASPFKAELRSILQQAQQICRDAGTSLKNVVRIQQFHSNLADFPAALEVWHEALDGEPIPISAIEVEWLPVPGARVMLDLWVHMP